jgi:translation initiation factor IF-3
MVKNRRLHKINMEITFPTLRISGDGIESKVVTKYEAIKIAEDLGKDVILISDKANPPFCKIEDYNKFIYDQEKKKKEIEKNAPKNETKELSFGVFIADHDLEVKAKKGKEFLEEGSKVKCSLLLKSREKATPEKGELVLLKFYKLVESVGSLEAMPKLDGNKWYCIIKPKSKNN